MGWFVRFDRFGDTHVCYSQERSNSCGICCIKMAVFKINKFRPGAAALTNEDQVERAYLRHDTDLAALRSQGALPAALASTLNDLSVGSWTVAQPAADRIADFIIDNQNGTPMLLASYWTGGTGGHCIMVDGIHHVPLTGYYWACVCDPGDGNVHVTRLNRGSALVYEGRRAPGINFWGEPEHNYAAGTTLRGAVSAIVHCTSPPGWLG
jgi:hypothetical protein